MINELGVAQLMRRDIVLEAIIEKIKTVSDIKSSRNVFHDVITCVVDQQIHYRSRGGVANKMMALLDGVFLTPENILSIDEKQFEAFKISRVKYETVLRVTDFFQKQPYSFADFEKMTDDEVRTALSSIQGIGNWTIDMILMYTLQRPDVFPADDYHLKNLMVALYQLDAKTRLKSQMLEVAESWSPYRSLGVQFLFAWKDFKKK